MFENAQNCIMRMLPNESKQRDLSHDWNEVAFCFSAGMWATILQEVGWMLPAQFDKLPGAIRWTELGGVSLFDFQGVSFQKFTKYVMEEIGFEEMHLFRVRRMCIDALDSFWCFSRAFATTLISFSLNEKMKGDLLSVTDSSTSYFPETLQIRTCMRVSKGTTSNFVENFQNFWIGYIWYLFCYRGETTQSKRSSHLDVFHCCQAPCPRRICGSAVWRGLVSVNLEVYPRCYEYLADMAGMVLVCDKSTRFKQLIMWCCEYRFPMFSCLTSHA